MRNNPADGAAENRVAVRRYGAGRDRWLLPALPWLKQGRPAWLLIPAALSLALFAWLLAQHPTAAGRVYAAYGGVYIAAAIGWLWAVDGTRPTPTDLLGVAVSLVGMCIIMFGRDA